MGTVTAESIINRALGQLNDVDEVRYSSGEMLGYLNAGQKAIVLLKHDAYVVNKSVLLTASQSKQTIPSDGFRFITAVRNMGVVDGTAPGRAITGITFSELDRVNADWHSAVAADNLVRHVLFNKDDPRNYYIYPTMNVGVTGWIEIAYAATPPDITNIKNAISLDDVYENALYNYLMYSASSKDTTAADVEKAKSFFNLFSSVISLDAMADSHTGGPS